MLLSVAYIIRNSILLIIRPFHLSENVTNWCGYKAVPSSSTSSCRFNCRLDKNVGFMAALKSFLIWSSSFVYLCDFCDLDEPIGKLALVMHFWIRSIWPISRWVAVVSDALWMKLALSCASFCRMFCFLRN